jgi:hypothetical protein
MPPWLLANDQTWCHSFVFNNSHPLPPEQWLLAMPSSPCVAQEREGPPDMIGYSALPDRTTLDICDGDTFFNKSQYGDM